MDGLRHTNEFGLFEALERRIWTTERLNLEQRRLGMGSAIVEIADVLDDNLEVDWRGLWRFRRACLFRFDRSRKFASAEIIEGDGQELCELRQRKICERLKGGGDGL